MYVSSGLPASALHLDAVGFSDIVSIRNKVVSLQAEGKPVYGFHGGEPDFETPGVIKEAMAAALRDNRTRYAPSSGIEPLRAAIAHKLREKNHLNATTEDVLVTVGGMQGLVAAFEAVLDRGEEIMVFSPYWTPIGEMILYVGARPILVPVSELRSDGILLVLKRYLTPSTRAIYYNTPANPTGEVFDRKDAELVAAFAIEHNLMVIADEAYEDIVYEGEHCSIASLPGMGERTITCFTLSKSYGMTGWRIGYVVPPRRFMAALQKVVLYTTNGVSTPVQWAALAAFSITPGFLADARSRYRERRDLLVSGLNELGFATALPGGSFYAFPNVRSIHADSREAAQILLERANIATIPGSVFGPHGEGFVRFGFAVPTAMIQQGLVALRAFVRETRG